MKRVGFLFDDAFTIKNLYLAYLEARKGKMKKRECYKFSINLGTELQNLHNEIMSGTYTPKPYKTFYVYEPKKRLIHAPHFRDTVVQHAIYRIIYPIFNRSFINTNYACRIGYGTHKASDYLQKTMRKCASDLYYLQMDIYHYFQSIDLDIDLEILKSLIQHKIKDNRFVNIMMLFNYSHTTNGMPIGNLLSQIYASIYLNLMDQYIKHILKIQYYLRYVDDFVFMGLSKDELINVKNQIITFIKTKLNLRLSHYTVNKIKKGINFVGYRTWKNKRFIRKLSLYKFKRKLKLGLINSVYSILGHARNTNSLNYLLNLIKEYRIDLQIQKNYRQIYNN